MTEEKTEQQQAKIKVGINGFGRIGRMVLRVMLQRNDVAVVAINDLLPVDYLAYAFKYDSTHGTYRGDVQHDQKPVVGKDDKVPGEPMGSIMIDGNFLTIFSEMKGENIPWSKIPMPNPADGFGSVDVVLDCSGFYLTKEKAQAHFHDQDGEPTTVKKVIMSAPPKDETPMFVMGVNNQEYAGEAIFSNASCTTNCLAPPVKLLDETFGIKSGLMTTVHAVTATQRTVDAPNPKKWRSGRGAYQSIIPATTGGAKAVAKVYTPIAGKMDGMAFRVPVPDGSVVDLTCVLSEPITKEQLDDAFRGAQGDYLGYTEDEIVSSDIVGDPHSSIYDSKASMVLNGRSDTVKVICWYDNEWGYSNRLVDLLVYSFTVPPQE